MSRISFWAIHYSDKHKWYIQWGYPHGLGTAFDPPLPGHTGFRTKREAEAFKRENLTGTYPPPKPFHSLSAILAGVPESEEQQCAEINKTDPLRAALAWKWFSRGGAKRRILVEMLGISYDELQAYVDTGSISESNRTILECHK